MRFAGWLAKRRDYNHCPPTGAIPAARRNFILVPFSTATAIALTSFKGQPVQWPIGQHPALIPSFAGCNF